MPENEKSPEQLEADRVAEEARVAALKVKEQPTGLSDAAKLEIATTMARESNNRATLLEQQLDEFKRKARENDNRQPEVKIPTKDEFYDKPAESTAAIVKKLLDESLAPLKVTVQEFSRDRSYGNLRNKFSNDPRFKIMFERIGNTIDTMMSKHEPTDDNMTMVLLGLRGAADLGMLGDVTFKETKTEDRRIEEPVQAHLAPSGSPRPESDRAPKLRTLTEEEDRIRRKHGLTNEGYLKAFDGPDEININDLDAALKLVERK